MASDRWVHDRSVPKVARSSTESLNPHSLPAGKEASVASRSSDELILIRHSGPGLGAAGKLAASSNLPGVAVRPGRRGDTQAMAAAAWGWMDLLSVRCCGVHLRGRRAIGQQRTWGTPAGECRAHSATADRSSNPRWPRQINARPGPPRPAENR